MLSTSAGPRVKELAIKSILFFTPNFKEFLQILWEKNQDAIKTKPRFWETV